MFEANTVLEKIYDPRRVGHSGIKYRGHTRDRHLHSPKGGSVDAPRFFEISNAAHTLEVASSPEGESWGRVVVVSNRLPFNITHETNGSFKVSPSSGGLVTAMSPLLREGVAGKWVGWPGTSEEEGLEEALLSAPNGPFEVGVVHLTQAEEEQYYQGYSNKVLCPLFEGEIDKVDFENADAYWPIYQNVQKKFARKIKEDITSRDIIWVQDYHLAGVAKELKDMGVTQPIGYFLHMPFPKKEDIALLPHRDEFLRNLLSYDILGLQTQTFKKHFVDAVEEYIPEATIERVSDTVTMIHIDGRTIRLGNFPISIDSKEFLEQAHDTETEEYKARLEKELRHDGRVKMIFNAGRLDYTKGFYEELLAFDRLLEKHPDLLGNVILFQLAIPSRESIPAYKEYKEKIVALAEQINQKYKPVFLPETPMHYTDGFEPYLQMPVRQVHAHMTRPVYLAHVATADIQSVPTKADGMNLVAKESAVTGKDTMVQILGKDAGAAEELGDYALLVNPEDTEAFAAALYSALHMSEQEKRERKIGLSEVVITNDVFKWWSSAQEPVFQQVWDEKKLPSSVSGVAESEGSESTLH